MDYAGGVALWLVRDALYFEVTCRVPMAMACQFFPYKVNTPRGRPLPIIIYKKWWQPQQNEYLID
jgi:hypothetical protein